jgi:hypothetical protein
MSDDHDIVVRREAAVWREVDGETILLDLRTADYVGINGSGSLLWEAMVAGTTRAELVQLLVSTFGLDEERAREDVELFLSACRGRGLIE